MKINWCDLSCSSVHGMQAQKVNIVWTDKLSAGQFIVRPCDTCHLELYPTANRRSHAPITYILFDCKFEKWPKRRVGIALVMQKNKNKPSKYIFIYLVKALLSPLCTSLSLWFIHQVVVWVCSLLGVNTNLKRKKKKISDLIFTFNHLTNLTLTW